MRRKKRRRKKKKTKRVGLDVLASRFKVWDTNIVCVYNFDLVVLLFWL